MIIMTSKSEFENLCLLIALQMAGFIVLEIIIWILLAIGVMPPTLILKRAGDIIIQVNSGYLVIAGLMSVLVAGFWLALLAEVFGFVEIHKVKLKI